jgi:hypothetical protein
MAGVMTTEHEILLGGEPVPSIASDVGGNDVLAASMHQTHADRGPMHRSHRRSGANSSSRYQSLEGDQRVSNTRWPLRPQVIELTDRGGFVVACALGG